MSDAVDPPVQDDAVASTSNASNEPDIQVVPVTETRDASEELYDQTKVFLNKFYADQSQVYFRGIWEIPYTVLRRKAVMGRVRPIAVEVGVQPDFFVRAQHPILSPASDRRRITDRTFMARILFNDRRKNRMRILKRLSRLSDTCYRGVAKRSYEFTNGEFKLVNTNNVTMENRFMQRPEGAVWDWPANFSNILDDPVELKVNYCIDNEESAIRALIERYDQAVHDRCALDPEVVSANANNSIARQEAINRNNAGGNIEITRSNTVANEYATIIRNISDNLTSNVCNIVNGTLADNITANVSNVVTHNRANAAFINNISRIIGHNISNAIGNNGDANVIGFHVGSVVRATLISLIGNDAALSVANSVTQCITRRARPAAANAALPNANLNNNAPRVANNPPPIANVAPRIANNAPRVANNAAGAPNNVPRVANNAADASDDSAQYRPRMSNNTSGGPNYVANYRPRIPNNVPLGANNAGNINNIAARTVSVYERVQVANNNTGNNSANANNAGVNDALVSVNENVRVANNSAANVNDAANADNALVAANVNNNAGVNNPAAGRL